MTNPQLEQAVHDAMAGALDRANARIVRQSRTISHLLRAIEMLQDQVERLQSEAG